MSAQAAGETGKGLVVPGPMADFVALLNDALRRQALYRPLRHCRSGSGAAASAPSCATGRVDQSTPDEAACRIVILEDQLEEAPRITAACRRIDERSASSASG